MKGVASEEGLVPIAMVIDGDFKHFDWVDNFDWDNLGKVWKEGVKHCREV